MVLNLEFAIDKLLVRVVAFLLVALLMASSAEAFTSLLDDFEDGTTQGWTVGPSPNPPANSSEGGGPAGAGDHFMRMTSNGGFSAGSRLIVFNRSQWTGDLLSANPVAFQLDVRNPGNTDVMLRAAFQSNGFETYASADPVLVSAGSDWQTITLGIAVDDLVSLGTSATYEQVMSGVMETRLLSSADPAFIGDQFVATLDVDNVRLIAIPEPATSSMMAVALAAGIGGYAVRRRRPFAA